MYIYIYIERERERFRAVLDASVPEYGFFGAVLDAPVPEYGFFGAVLDTPVPEYGFDEHVYLKHVLKQCFSLLKHVLLETSNQRSGGTSPKRRPEPPARPSSRARAAPPIRRIQSFNQLTQILLCLQSLNNLIFAIIATLLQR